MTVDKFPDDEDILGGLDFETPNIELLNDPTSGLFYDIAVKVDEAIKRAYAQVADDREPDYQHYFHILSKDNRVAIYLVPRLRADFDVLRKRPTEDRSGVLLTIPNTIQHIIESHEFDEVDAFDDLMEDLYVANHLSEATLECFDSRGNLIEIWTVNRDCIELQNVRIGWHEEYCTQKDMETVSEKLSGMLGDLTPGHIRVTNKEVVPDEGLEDIPETDSEEE